MIFIDYLLENKELAMGVLTILIVMALISTVVALGWGIVSMGHGGSYDEKHSVQLMGVRVGLQMLAIALLFVAMIIQLT